MIYIYYLLCALLLAILETVGLTQFFGSVIYDLQIPLIITVSILGRAYRAFVVVVIVALIMDALSGGPFGIYFTAYAWLFLIIKVLSLIINMQSFLIIAPLIIAGVIFENFVFMFVQILSIGAVPNFETQVMPLVLRQCLIAFITGPVIVYILRRGHVYLEGLQKNKPEIS